MQPRPAAERRLQERREQERHWQECSAAELWAQPAARRKLDFPAPLANIDGDRGSATKEAAMSFWSALFGRRSSAEAAKVSEPVEYKGFVIRAAPYKNNGGYQTAGTIEREIGGVRKEHRFIRADSYTSYDDAVSFTLNKARQIVDLQGERMFD
jgi:hypothetical protein